MKKFLILVCAIFTFSAMAKTTNWYVDGTLYQTSSCTSGDDVTPPTAPAKRGYTFTGWLDANLVIGSWSQSGTPSPTNPVYPTFYQDGDLILRAVGTGNNLVADTYNTETGKITRRIGVKVLDGTEGWNNYATGAGFSLTISDMVSQNYGYGFCSHINYTSSMWIQGIRFGANNNIIYVCQITNMFSTLTEWKQYLADQYAAGTPVTIYYPLATPTEEVYIPAQ